MMSGGHADKSDKYLHKAAKCSVPQELLERIM
jgi:hypothetical protein